MSVLGCAVNGIGEARHADFGITGAKDMGMIYSKGEPLKKVPTEQLVDELFKEIDRYYAAGKTVQRDETAAAEARDVAGRERGRHRDDARADRGARGGRRRERRSARRGARVDARAAPAPADALASGRGGRAGRVALARRRPALQPQLERRPAASAAAAAKRSATLPQSTTFHHASM